MAVLKPRAAAPISANLLSIIKPRQDHDPLGDGNSSPTPVLSTNVIAIIAVVGALFLIISSASFWALRRQKGPKTKTAPSTAAKPKSFFARFRADSARGAYLQPNPSQTGDGESLSQARSSEARDVEMELVRDGPAAAASTTDAGVDRHTSVRSVMTLPPYSFSARPTEQVIGREGERAGIDLVLEHPETVNEEEERRDEEMESLFQIRQARRQEAAEREERRRLRREARARGDTAAVARMADESRQRARQAASGVTVSAQLIAEHQTKNRDRRVSAVQYQHVGVARHDGSRVRAPSIEADDRPLLSSAASMSGTRSRPDSLQLGMQHGRDRSTTSFQSVSSIDSSHSSSSDVAASHDFEVISLHDGGSLSQSRSRASSAARSIPASIPTPAEPPPNYDEQQWGDAPPYESPVVASAPQLPRLAPIPSIRISPTQTPSASPRP